MNYIIWISHFAFFAFAYKRLLRYLRYFQQEEYDTRRFVPWIFRTGSFDKRGTLAVIFSFVLLVVFSSVTAAALALSALLILIFVIEKDPRQTGKIRLNMTERARRIFNVAAAIFTALFVALILITEYQSLDSFVGHILLIQLIPAHLVLANFILSPFERRVKERFKGEAKAMLDSIAPYTIGITGSYGKTSTKAALGEILNTALGPTFCPPKSINTEMGITREIRENLNSNHKYAVIEMGAYNVGSIKRLCNLTPPKAGIVTVVGMAHLERYGTVERVYKAKSELPQALPDDGILICNGDDQGSRRMALEFPKKITRLYGMRRDLGPLDCLAEKVVFSPTGTSFEVSWEGKTYPASTKLLGTPALSNILAAFTMACSLGADPEFVVAAIRNIEPVENRLSLSREGKVTFLRDAYNSNPLGFAAALEVLDKLPANRKILMTPGMIELGDMQFEENHKAASAAATVCDLVLIVGLTNREALSDGLIAAGFKTEAIVFCITRAEAFLKLNETLRNGDLVLIENDLPDLYEAVEAF